MYRFLDRLGSVRVTDLTSYCSMQCFDIICESIQNVSVSLRKEPGLYQNVRRLAYAKIDAVLLARFSATNMVERTFSLEQGGKRVNCGFRVKACEATSPSMTGQKS
jgi:hypothetical protein